MTIVSEIKAEGDAAVRRWALELDGVEPARAEPDARRHAIDFLAHRAGIGIDIDFSHGKMLVTRGLDPRVSGREQVSGRCAGQARA